MTKTRFLINATAAAAVVAFVVPAQAVIPVPIKPAAQDFPLELVFRQTVNGKVADLTNVPLKITDASGKVVFQGESPGPYFIARLPAGRYNVTAHWDDWNFSKDVTIGAGHDRVVFAWKRDTPNVG